MQQTEQHHNFHHIKHSKKKIGTWPSAIQEFEERHVNIPVSPFDNNEEDENDENNKNDPKSIQIMIMRLVEKLLLSKKNILETAVIPGQRRRRNKSKDTTTSMLDPTMWFKTQAAKIIEKATGQNVAIRRLEQFDHTLDRLGHLFNLRKNIAKMKKKIESELSRQASVGAASSVNGETLDHLEYVVFEFDILYTSTFFHTLPLLCSNGTQVRIEYARIFDSTIQRVFNAR